MKVLNRKGVIGIQVAIFCFCLCLSLMIGPFEVDWDTMLKIIRSWFNGGALEGDSARAAYVIEQIRLPRILLGALAGVNLAVSGAIMQNILKNPLADPYVLGLSSSAAFGAALYIVLGQTVITKAIPLSQSLMIAVNAFLFAIISLALVMFIVKASGRGTVMMLLSGIAIGGLFSAGLSLLKYFSNNDALKDLQIWLMGGFWGANYHNIIVLTAVSALCIGVIYSLSWKLNAIAIGDDLALTMGVNVKLVNNLAIVLATLMVAATIAFSGVIGFVGLVCPFISRGLVGTDNRYLLPSSMLTGGILLALADLVGRNIISPAEIPVGIVTAILGTPFFLYMLAQKKARLW